MKKELGIQTVLIANRGEVARRIIQSVHALGYRSVAVYSDIDRNSAFVKQADRAVYLGGSEPCESYLHIDRIIAAALEVKADAIHPGYGFLAENAEFVARVEQAGLVFVGPNSEVVRAMGDKAHARQLAEQIGLRCIPGYHGADQSDLGLHQAAEQIGLPLMIKAAAGGGGRGMRLVEAWPDFKYALHSARSEAISAFGTAELIIERALVEPRHIEIQVMADQYGHAIHLGERECSIQRRHQKLIEEAPAPAVDESLRQQMGEAALAIVRHLQYVGVGTVEFLLDQTGEFYFMEMNTRLQVEHAVTEQITGVDIVDWQLRIAAGQPLSLQQDDIRFTGHAIEVRLTAEDVENGFLPQTGTVLAWQPETLNGAVRIEHDLTIGQTLSPYYDSMIAKVIATAPTRNEAIQKLVRALEKTVLLGIAVNQDFLIRCLNQADFRAGQVATNFVAKHSEVLLSAAPPPIECVVIAGLIHVMRGQQLPQSGLSFATSGLSLQVDMELSEQRYCVLLTPKTHRFALQLFDAKNEQNPLGSWDIDHLEIEDGLVRVSVNNISYTLPFYLQNSTLFVFWQGKVQKSHQLHSRSSADQLDGNGVVYAPMTGRVIGLHVKEGQQVKRGDLIAVIEAMKMEHSLLAESDGVIKELTVAVGDQAHAQQRLVVIEKQSEVCHG